MINICKTIFIAKTNIQVAIIEDTIAKLIKILIQFIMKYC